MFTPKLSTFLQSTRTLLIYFFTENILKTDFSNEYAFSAVKNIFFFAKFCKLFFCKILPSNVENLSQLCMTISSFLLRNVLTSLLLNWNVRYRKPLHSIKYCISSVTKRMNCRFRFEIRYQILSI